MIAQCREDGNQAFRTSGRLTSLVALVTLLSAGSYSQTTGQDSSAQDQSLVASPVDNAEQQPLPELDCGYQSAEEWQAQIADAVARGEIPDPRTRVLPVVQPRRPQTGEAPQCLAPDHVFAFEDTEGLLLTNFSNGQLFNLMAEGANALMAEHGDNFDFIGFWVNFEPHHRFGTAFYLSVENDVLGIGLGLFNRRASFGIAGGNIEGFVMMWNINSSFWQPGEGPDAAFTRLVLGQEFEHRFAMFLPRLFDGRILQGDNSGCGRAKHWNHKVDGQGSGMEIADWIGSSPAIRRNDSLNFNSDIGGVFSYADLYLMGFVSPQEMDAGNSELRYLNDGCNSPYSGLITTFSSADIISTAGERIPDSTQAQKDFRTGWVMIHRPGDPPSEFEATKTADILEQHMFDWNFGTLTRGTMNNSLFDDCNCNGVPDDEDIANGTSEDRNGDGRPDECQTRGDFDGDGDLDLFDCAEFFNCAEGPQGEELPPACKTFDFNDDDHVSFADFGSFQAAFTGDCAILVSQQPESVVACIGDAVEFEVRATGADLTYQWNLDFVPIPGGTEPVLIVDPVNDQSEGSYSVFMRSSCDVELSDFAELGLHDPPIVVSHPEFLRTCPKAPAQFSVEATGVEPLGYQWFLDNQPILGADMDTYVIDSTMPEDLGEYMCEITDACDQSVFSDAAGLVFHPPVEIVDQPVGGEFCVGDQVTLFVIDSGGVTYQWFQDNVPIDGATSFFLIIADAQTDDSGVYHVEVFGECDAAVSDDAVVRVINCGP